MNDTKYLFYFILFLFFLWEGKKLGPNHHITRKKNSEVTILKKKGKKKGGPNHHIVTMAKIKF